jgi:ribonucleotide reductase alpha subunit
LKLKKKGGVKFTCHASTVVGAITFIAQILFMLNLPFNSENSKELAANMIIVIGFLFLQFSCLFVRKWSSKKAYPACLADDR